MPMHVIITRPSEDAETFAREVARLGATPVLSPVMAIRPRKIAIDLGGVSALAFTSANGVRAFSALSAERDVKVFAVGTATAEAARLAGFQDIEAAQGDVESLAALISASKPTPSALHLAGSERAGDLLGLLSASGVAARREVIYDADEIATLSPEAAAILADREQKSLVVFFSPRSARLFLAQAARAAPALRLDAAEALCLSGAIAAAAEGGGWSAVRIARELTAAAMLREIEDALAERKGRMIAPREAPRGRL